MVDDVHFRSLINQIDFFFLGSLTTWTYKQWADKIAANFERHFWINTQPSNSETRPDLVHRRGIYKDTHGASQPWSDYQFRCNFPIAMVVVSNLSTFVLSRTKSVSWIPSLFFFYLRLLKCSIRNMLGRL